MKLIIDIDDNVFTRLFDNGVDTSSEDRKVIDRAVRNGKPYEERPHGEWIITGEEQGALGITYKIRKCNKCGWEHSLVISDNFCPNCGADMRGGRE